MGKGADPSGSAFAGKIGVGPTWVALHTLLAEVDRGRGPAKPQASGWNGCQPRVARLLDRPILGHSGLHFRSLESQHPFISAAAVCGSADRAEDWHRGEMRV